MRVLIVDDHAMVRGGTRLILQQACGETEADDAGCVQEALAKVADNEYDLVILDLSLPDGSGFTVLETIRRDRPKLPVIVVSMFVDDDYAVRAFSLGADGYLSKGCQASELICAVRKVVTHGKYISERNVAAVVAGLRNVFTPVGEMPLRVPLSPQEKEVAKLLVAGESNKEIAWKLSLNVKTVSTYKTRILKKTQVRNQTELVKFALTNKWFGQANPGADPLFIAKD